MTAEDVPAAEVLADHGIRVRLEPGELVTGAILITRILTPTGETGLGTSCTPGMTWLERLGLLVAASDQTRREVGQE